MLAMPDLIHISFFLFLIIRKILLPRLNIKKKINFVINFGPWRFSRSVWIGELLSGIRLDMQKIRLDSARVRYRANAIVTVQGTFCLVLIILRTLVRGFRAFFCSEELNSELYRPFAVQRRFFFIVTEIISQYILSHTKAIHVLL